MNGSKLTVTMRIITGLFALWLAGTITTSIFAAPLLQARGDSCCTARWQGKYFNNQTLSGTPALVRQDDVIDFNWGTGAPAAGIAADNFSIRWTRTIFLEPGRYRFSATADDGVRLWVAGQLLIDKWFDQAETTHQAEINLPGGATDVRMEYYENVGGASARLKREQISGSVEYTWFGEYFNNRDLAGSPALTRTDSTISFDWGGGSPATGINVDNFSVRWTRTVNFAAGRYRFTAHTDDGLRLWINGQLIIDAWYDHKPQDFVAEIYLPAGPVNMRMEYYENVGGAKAFLTYTQIYVAPPPPPTPPGVGTVFSLRLNLRQGPGVANAIITILNQGEMVSLWARNQNNTWVQVSITNGTKGWVYAPLLQTSIPVSNLPLAEGLPPLPVSDKPTAVVSDAVYALNVRQGPGMDFTVITAINRGTTVELLGRNSSGYWVKVKLPNGIQGWASANYLVSSTNYNSLPILQSAY